MPEMELTYQQVAEFEHRFLDATPSQGSIGNSALRRKLQWDEQLYSHIRNRLLEAGVVGQGRGRGGSVYRLVAPSLPTQSLAGATAPPRVTESITKSRTTSSIAPPNREDGTPAESGLVLTLLSRVTTRINTSPASRWN
jgi:hypothetical protein